MKNSISIMKYVFCIIGLVLITEAFTTYQEKATFKEKANVVQGVVLDIASDDKTFVSFTSEDGKQIKFSSYTNFVSYDYGERVEVFYDSKNPYNAKINSFNTLYLGVSIFGFAGSVFFLTGFSFFRSDYLKQKKIQFLKQSGRRIITKFSQIQLNIHVTVNGSHPYFICSKWLDSETNKTYLFESENIWLDPREFNVTDEIIVLIDPENPEKYHMDISFLTISR